MARSLAIDPSQLPGVHTRESLLQTWQATVMHMHNRQGHDKALSSQHHCTDTRKVMSSLSTTLKESRAISEQRIERQHFPLYCFTATLSTQQL
jgi:hypothetical protein